MNSIMSYLPLFGGRFIYHPAPFHLEIVQHLCVLAGLHVPACAVKKYIGSLCRFLPRKGMTLNVSFSELSVNCFNYRSRIYVSFDHVMEKWHYVISPYQNSDQPPLTEIESLLEGCEVSGNTGADAFKSCSVVRRIPQLD